LGEFRRRTLPKRYRGVPFNPRRKEKGGLFLRPPISISRISPHSICGTTFPYPLGQTVFISKNVAIQTVTGFAAEEHLSPGRRVPASPALTANELQAYLQIRALNRKFARTCR